MQENNKNVFDKKKKLFLEKNRKQTKKLKPLKRQPKPKQEQRENNMLYFIYLYKDKLT